MTRGAALLLAIGFATGAFLYSGVWAYGDGFIFNRYSGEVIYVELPEEDDVHLPAHALHHVHRGASLERVSAASIAHAR